jgi:hypothetical protein
MPIANYAGLPILTGYGPGRNPDILPFEETPNGGGAAEATSIYAVRFGEDGVEGIANGGIMVNDQGLIDDGVTYRTTVEWYLGMAVWDPYAIGRLTSVTNAAISA